MRQLKLFAPVQGKCWHCGISFVPYAKESIALWHENDDAPIATKADENWATDRTYQENLRYCSTRCLYKKEAQDLAAGLKKPNRKPYHKR